VRCNQGCPLRAKSGHSPQSACSNDETADFLRGGEIDGCALTHHSCGDNGECVFGAEKIDQRTSGRRRATALVEGLIALNPDLRDALVALIIVIVLFV
jgi:hypothetical protein